MLKISIRDMGLKITILRLWTCLAVANDLKVMELQNISINPKSFWYLMYVFLRTSWSLQETYMKNRTSVLFCWPQRLLIFGVCVIKGLSPNVKVLILRLLLMTHQKTLQSLATRMAWSHGNQWRGELGRRRLSKDVDCFTDRAWWQ